MVTKNRKQSQKKDNCPTVQQTAKKAEQKRFAFPKKKKKKLCHQTFFDVELCVYWYVGVHVTFLSSTKQSGNAPKKVGMLRTKM
jgi:hypothetical protein